MQVYFTVEFILKNISFYNILKIVFGGGRSKFLPYCAYNISDLSKCGERTDERNLVNEWISKMKNAGKKYKYIWNMER